MTRHLADHRSPPGSGRVRQFIAIARTEGDGVLRSLAKRPVSTSSNRRLVEFLRIERGRTV